MGTRGMYGFRFNGVEKCSYNHFDSYPDYLGANMAEFCEKHSVDEMKRLFNRIKLVSEDSVPSDAQIDKMEPFADETVGKRTVQDWYCLLRELQGDLEKLIQIPGEVYMIDNHDFIKDSLFCEYAYIIDLNKEVLEFWIGFQRKPWAENPYGTDCEDGYYPCRKYAEFDLGADAEKVLKDMKEIDENKEKYEDDCRNEQDRIVDAAEAIGWTVKFDSDKSVRFSRYSPGGEDLESEYEFEDLAHLARQIRETSDDFDVDEHVYMWLNAKFHGCGSVPGAEELVEDAKEIENMYEQLACAIENL